MKYIEKIKLQNFKRFRTFSVDFDKDLNILVGDNESGKSTILSAINLVLSGSIARLESIGLESLFNTEVIQKFLNSEKDYDNLPTLLIELYLNEQHDFRLNGKNNSDERICDGLRLECVPNDDLSKEINEILKQKETAFPFEYYSSKFITFSGDGFTGNKKYLRHVLIDNSQISSEYAMREYVKDMYNSHTIPVEKNKHQNEYRKYKESFKNRVLDVLNSRLENYSFTLKHNSKANLETDLTLSENEINIENQGKGKQCIIKTEFALSKHEDINDIILIEEPENHLSHVNMKKVIRNISESSKKQLFIATHSNMISARLDLRCKREITMRVFGN
ncbi:MAG: AAA family ATPase [Pseudomonadota bacterium]